MTLREGGSYVHHADSFALIRGGHLDLCVLGAFEVAENGDIANWSRSDNDFAPAVGGAMDLAVGAKRLWAVMEHTTKSGESRLVKTCSYPLTALSVPSAGSTPTWRCWTSPTEDLPLSTSSPASTSPVCKSELLRRCTYPVEPASLTSTGLAWRSRHWKERLPGRHWRSERLHPRASRLACC